MGTRVANPSDSKPLMTEAEARDIAEDMREKGWHAMAFYNGQQQVVFAKDDQGKLLKSRLQGLYIGARLS